MPNDFAILTEELSRIVQEDFLAWPEVGRGDNVTLHERPGSLEDNFVCLLVSSIEQIPFEALSDFRRPENVEILSQLNSNMDEGEVIKVYAPGDCLVKTKLRLSAKVSMMALMSHSGSSGSVPTMALNSPGYLRIFRRIDYPAPGMLHVLWGTVGKPPSSEAGDSEESDSASSGLPEGSIASRIARGQACMCDVLEPLENGEATRVNFFTFIPAEHKWMIPTIAKTWCSGTNETRHFLNFACRQQLDPPYVVLRLKKCSRGPPLRMVLEPELPCFSGELMNFNGGYWTQGAVQGNFSLLVFLQRLLRDLGLEKYSQDIFDSLEGRRLVFFQAAVRATAWRELSPYLTAFFSKHAAAYRHWYGGRAAPHLQAGAAPLFLDNHIGPQHALDDSPSWSHEMPWRLKNTFIHFGEGTAMLETAKLV